jgi:hypothetical protein
MRIVIVSKKPVLTPTGRLPTGIPIEVNDHLAKFLIERGEAQTVETKEAQDRPMLPAGRAEPSLALPAGQASTKRTWKRSGGGAKAEKTEAS